MQVCRTRQSSHHTSTRVSHHTHQIGCVRPVVSVSQSVVTPVLPRTIGPHSYRHTRARALTVRASRGLKAQNMDESEGGGGEGMEAWKGRERGASRRRPKASHHAQGALSAVTAAHPMRLVSHIRVCRHRATTRQQAHRKPGKRCSSSRQIIAIIYATKAPPEADDGVLGLGLELGERSALRAALRRALSPHAKSSTGSTYGASSGALKERSRGVRDRQPCRRVVE